MSPVRASANNATASSVLPTKPRHASNPKASNTKRKVPRSLSVIGGPLNLSPPDYERPPKEKIEHRCDKSDRQKALDEGVFVAVVVVVVIVVGEVIGLFVRRIPGRNSTVDSGAENRQKVAMSEEEQLVQPE